MKFSINKEKNEWMNEQEESVESVAAAEAAKKTNHLEKQKGK